MQEELSDSRPESGTQGRAYTDAERARIQVLARGKTNAAEIAALFPDRTVAAVKQQIVSERHRLGLVEARDCQHRGDGQGTVLERDDPGYTDTWWPTHVRNMRHGSAMLLQALRAA